MRNQTTIRREVGLKGVGLHSGSEVEIWLCPSKADSGIRFLADGGGESEAFSVTPMAVSSTERGTVLRGANGDEIRTVEHLLAACYGLRIDNLLVRVRGGEIPAADGSSLPFVHLLLEAGQALLPEVRRVAAPSSPIWVADGDACLVALPSSNLEVTFAVSYPFVGSQLASFVMDPDSFVSDLAPARTFGFRHEADQIHAAGLAQGANLDNVLLVDERGYSSPLRFPDELARHKILDLLGDLALTRADLQCRILAVKSGHRLNNQLARAIFSQIETGGCDVNA